MKKVRGGYDIRLAGRPSRTIQQIVPPQRLLLPRRTRRFLFGQACVEEGARVKAGDVLARDGKNFDLPLVAPMGGTVSWTAQADHAVLGELEPPACEEQATPVHAPSGGETAAKRRQLVDLGAWAFVEDAYSGKLPDPQGTPAAVIVSTLRLEPYQARGDVQMMESLLGFIRGLEHLQSLLEYQPIYLLFPNVRSEFAQQVRQQLRGHAWIKLVEVPLLYPHDNMLLCARRLGFRRDQIVWTLGPDAVLAVDAALTHGRSVSSRVISLGGPGVKVPVHLRVTFGHPLEELTAGRLEEGECRVINGGALNGYDATAAGQFGVDIECQGLTIVPENVERELLGWTRPGLDRRSYSNSYLSALRGSFDERMTTAMRGERRPCISCSFCEEVCPTGVMPHLIHKLLYADRLEDVERSRVDLCMDCGLCAFVCPSKIELREDMHEARRRIETELHAAEEH